MDESGVLADASVAKSLFPQHVIPNSKTEKCSNPHKMNGVHQSNMQT